MITYTQPLGLAATTACVTCGHPLEAHTLSALGLATTGAAAAWVYRCAATIVVPAPATNVAGTSYTYPCPCATGFTDTGPPA